MDLCDYLEEERGRMARVARDAGIQVAFLSQIAKRKRPVPPGFVAALERACEGRVPRWHLRPKDWHRIWPELIGAEGAPALPQPGGGDQC